MLIPNTVERIGYCAEDDRRDDVEQLRHDPIVEKENNSERRGVSLAPTFHPILIVGQVRLIIEFHCGRRAREVPIRHLIEVIRVVHRHSSSLICPDQEGRSQDIKLIPAVGKTRC